MNIDWIDLPNENYVDVLGYETSHSKKLSQLIENYNAIQKDQENNLDERVLRLEQILSFLKNWIENELSGIEKKKHLNWLYSIAEGKKNYLSALKNIYREKKHAESSLKSYHSDPRDLIDKKFQPIVLNNRRLFSLKMREYWGDFWIESLDPCHRRLTPFYDQWMRESEKNKEIPHFFLWLENQHIPKYVPKVIYIEEKELPQFLVHVDDFGFLHYRNQLAEFSAQGVRYLFAIDLKKNIFVAEENQGYSHSSFTSGRPVLGAGLLNVEKGRLKGIALESGHYLPSVETGFQILQILVEKNTLFPNQLELTYFHDRNKYTALLNYNECKNFALLQKILDKTSKTTMAV